MRKIICIVRKEVADRIAEECACSYMTQALGDNTMVYTFIESDKIHKLLGDNTRFSKRDWYYEKRLKF